jgi:hypothetical protein
MAGEFAAGGLTDGAKRLLGSGPVDAASVFLSAPRARKLARRLSQMRGAAMKLGQLLSLEGDDLLPPEFAEALAVLRARRHRSAAPSVAPTARAGRRAFASSTSIPSPQPRSDRSTGR